nr:CatB-related O-acetyltransferase [Brevundimonas diminuta]
MGGNHTHRTDWFSLYPFPEVIGDAYVGKGDTRIGDGAWIGMRAMIMPGVTIGEGAVVASGAIVTREVEPYAIVAGNPAKPVRSRFDAETTALLLALRIYDWPTAKFEALRPLLTASDPRALREAVAAFDRDN